MRRLVPLKLKRDWNPVLHITWNLSHPLDSSSPLFGLDATNVQSKLLALVVYITGTYHQTVFGCRRQPGLFGLWLVRNFRF